LDAVAVAAAGDAAAPAELLGDYLPILAEAAVEGRRPEEDALARIARLGGRAARLGVLPGAAVNLYLTAAWRMWRQLPEPTRFGDSAEVRRSAEAVLQAVGDAVAALVDGFQAERREAIRREESMRRDFIDDLLRGDADVAGVVERAEPFGLDLGRPHRVALAAADSDHADLQLVSGSLESAVVKRYGDRDVLVATKGSALMALVPSSEADGGNGDAAGQLGELIHQTLTRGPGRASWRVAVGRGYAGAYGVARSYEEAREALDLARRMRIPQPVVQARDLLVFRVLGRDQAAMVDLVQGVLTPLQSARGGAEPLLATVETYLSAGGVATEAARRLHLSVRAVTYRLRRVRDLTGLDPTDPEHAFTLHAAVLGARLLDWPGRPLVS
jgi:sugar diacid utilization regulator